MDTWYWVLEYGKVFSGYIFMMFLWPSVVFYSHLKGRGRTYRFSFCVTVQVVIASTVVLMLGLFHCLHPRVIIVLFYGIFLHALLKGILKHSFFFQVKGAVQKAWRKKREYIGEYGVLAIVLIFGMIYFSYGAFQIHSYGFGDLYTHHEWIYGLKEGKIFSGGVYPEAMHCFIYCLDTLFGIRVYSSLMFLQGIHVSVFLLAGYLLMREIFHWRYTPLLALTLFLTLDVVSADLVYSMFRLQITLPLEFGLYTQFLCAFYLIRYLKSNHRVVRKEGLSRYCWDENLFLFFLSLTAAISIHYYAVIMAFILCGSFAVFLLRRMFSKEHFIPLACSVLCACVIAGTPMAGAMISGTQFNASINWAVGAMNGEETRALEEKTSADKMKKRERPVFAAALETAVGVYMKGYAELYGRFRAGMILFVTAAGITLCFLSGKRLPDWMREICSGYPPLILFTFVFVALYAAPRLGFPEIISDSRYCSVGHLLLMALMMLPADVGFSVFLRFFRGGILKAVSYSCAAGIYILTILTGRFHGYLFFELSRYNAAVKVTNQIIEEFPKKSYVIVSPTDELYPVIEDGWHEELLTFVTNIGTEGYEFAPEQAFFFVEKRPLQYAQAYFFDGPPWLAKAKYKDIYWDKYAKKYPDTGAAQAPKINASEISEEEAGKDLTVSENSWFSYTRLPDRTILEAKAYDWCRKFAELYPENTEIYYEDDDFVCYYFSQIEGSQYHLREE